MNVEIWDLYDAQGEKTGKTMIRGEAIPVGFYHIGVHIWPMNDKGELLIQRRSMGVQWKPGIWAVTGGSAVSGEEPLTAARRELREELGYAASKADMLFVSRHNHRLYELVKLIRYNLELTESLAVTLAEELDFVKTYIGLEEQVLQPGFEFHIDIDPALDIHRVKIPVMLLQIPVENAVKHALSCKDGIRMLWIEVKKDKDCIKALVRDNGGGFKVKSNSYGTGTGMKVLSQTIQLLNSYNRYPLIMQINNVEIKERGELGCEVKFTIPLDYSYLLGRAKDTNLWKRCIEQLSLMMKRVQ